MWHIELLYSDMRWARTLRNSFAMVFNNLEGSSKNCSTASLLNESFVRITSETIKWFNEQSLRTGIS